MMQQNRLCGDRDKTINHLISECRKLTQKKYKTRRNWMSKVIHLELRKKFKFDQLMHNPASVRENETHKHLCYFEIQTGHLILARRPDLVIINQKNRPCRTVNFAVPADHSVTLKENKKKDKYMDFGGEWKKLLPMKITIIQTVSGALSAVTEGLVQGLEELEKRG